MYLKLRGQRMVEDLQDDKTGKPTSKNPKQF